MARRKKTQEKAGEIREQFEHDPLRDFEGTPTELFVARMATAFRENLREILIGVAVVGVLLIGYIFYAVWADNREEQALIAFETLLEEPVMTPGAGAEDIAVEKIDEYLKSHSSGRAEHRADLYKMMLLAAKKKFAEAGEAAARLGEDVDSAELRAFFFLRAGYYFEMAEKYAPAQAAFGRAGQFVREDNVLRAAAWFGEGRALLQMGQQDEGRKAIERIFESNSAQIGEVRTAALAYLLARGNGTTERPGQ
ncbi:MAG: tetratricopeptide repeat protein [bacterium]|nr:tetratricopeptide repeat protein [bacterium]